MNETKDQSGVTTSIKVKANRLPICFFVGFCVPMFLPFMLYLNHKVHKPVKPPRLLDRQPIIGSLKMATATDP